MQISSQAEGAVFFPSLFAGSLPLLLRGARLAAGGWRRWHVPELMSGREQLRQDIPGILLHC